MLRRTPERAVGNPRMKQGEYRERAMSVRSRPPISAASVVSFQANAGERGLQQSQIPVAGLDHDGDGHAA